MIIHSLLDTDLYKFTMQQVVLHQFPGAHVKYRFKCRNHGIDLARHAEEIRSEIGSLCELRFREEEIAYLRTLRFLKPDYIDFLKIAKLDRDAFKVTPMDNGELDITVEGSWLHTILFEVPLLAIVNEVYFYHEAPAGVAEVGVDNLMSKLAYLHENIADSSRYGSAFQFYWSDFGTRRRFSRPWHEDVIRNVKRVGSFSGTSNVWMAYAHKLQCHGTQAHEHFQAMQGMNVRLADSQKYALECWAKEYRGDLGIALSDVFGLDAFLRDFDLYFCKLFDGCRHDSGDPIEWCRRIIEHYRKNKIDPRTKRVVFSDGLTMKSAINIYKMFEGEIQMAFGIGTSLTNDVGLKPLNIVMKMVECNGQPVAKLSDASGKTMCENEQYLAYCRQVFKIPPAQEAPPHKAGT